MSSLLSCFQSTTVETAPFPFTAAKYSDELLQSLNGLYAKQYLCDVELITGSERLIRAHRAVLCAASPYFHAMLTGSLREAQSEAIDMRPIGPPHIIEKLIDFIYTGHVDVTEDIAQDMLDAADMLRLVHVVDACCAFLVRQLHESNCLGIYLFADAHSCVHLRDAAETFIMQHFIGVIDSDEFCRFPLNVLLRFLQSDELRVETESQVLDAVVRWLDFDAATRRCCVYDLMASVRLSLVPLSLCKQAVDDCRDLGVKIAIQKLIQDVHTAASSSNVTRTVIPRRHARRTIYIVGGYCREVGARWSDCETLSRVDGFETYLRVWRSIPPLQSARSSITVVTLAGALYAVGGESESLISDSVERFDPMTSTRWQRVESMTTPRCGAGACAFNNRLYVFGGWIGAEIGKSVEVYDLQTNTWSLHDYIRGVPRYAMGIVEFQGLIYLIGGLNEMNMELNSVDVYNPVTRQWMQAADMQSRRGLVGVAVLNGFIYAVGGSTEDSGALASVERYSIDKDEWVYVSEMATARAGPAVTTVNGILYAFGGRTSTTEGSVPVTLSTVERYDLELDEWTDGGKMPIGRCEAGIAVL